MFDELSVMENIFIGNHIVKKNRLVDWFAMEKKTKELLSNLEADIKPDEKIKDLSIAQRHIVQISRSLVHDADIVIMDEPTASLSQKEIEELYSIIRNLKKQNKSIIFISHKLDEVLEICDEFTVLRDGEVIGYNYYFFKKDKENITVTNQLKFTVKLFGATIFLSLIHI